MRSEHRIPFVSVRVISVLLLLVLLVFPLFEEGAGSMNFKEGRRLIGTLAALASGTVEIGDWPCVFEIISAVFTGILLLAAFTKIKPLCTLSCFLALCGLITAGAVYIHLDSGVHDIFGATSDFSLCMWVVLGLFLLGFFCSLILDPPGDNFGWLITFSFLLFMLVLIFPVFEPNGGTLNFGIRGNLRAWIETLREGGSVGAEKWTVIFTLAITIPAGLAFLFAMLRKKIPAIVFASIGLLGWLCCMATFMVWTGKRGTSVALALFGSSASVPILTLLIVPLLFVAIIIAGAEYAGHSNKPCGANGGCVFMDAKYAAESGKPDNMVYCKKLGKFVFKRDRCPLFRSTGCADGICAHATHDHRFRCYCDHYKKVVIPKKRCPYYVYYFETGDFRKYVDSTAEKIM